jgi:hypothetical protein
MTVQPCDSAIRYNFTDDLSVKLPTAGRADRKQDPGMTATATGNG